MTNAHDEMAARVRAWLSERHDATLCTLLHDQAERAALSGTPFGSSVPYAIDEDGAPFVFVSSLATHTKNLLADPRASLLIQQRGPGDDPQAGWRVVVLGELRRQVVAAQHPRDEIVDDATLARLRARFSTAVPSAGRLLGLGGFSFWRMRPVHKVRVVEGFGRVGWLDGDALRPAG